MRYVGKEFYVEHHPESKADFEWLLKEYGWNGKGAFLCVADPVNSYLKPKIKQTPARLATARGFGPLAHCDQQRAGLV